MIAPRYDDVWAQGVAWLDSLAEDSGEATEQEDAPALCPCGERPATLAGFCDECRADGAGAP